MSGLYKESSDHSKRSGPNITFGHKSADNTEDVPKCTNETGEVRGSSEHDTDGVAAKADDPETCCWSGLMVKPLKRVAVPKHFFEEK